MNASFCLINKKEKKNSGEFIALLTRCFNSVPALQSLKSRISMIEYLMQTNPDDRLIDDICQMAVYSFEPLDGQKWLVERINAVGQGMNVSGEDKSGYKTGDQGHCFGISQMTIQAFLASDLQTFNNRLHVIKNMSVEQFKNDFAELRAQQRELREQGDLEKANQIRDLIVDISAFFDGIILYQKTINYKDLFENEKTVRSQDADKTMQITRPVISDSGHNLPVLLNCHSGAYDKTELKQYLDTLENHIGHHSFGLGLSSANHRITLCYDSSEKNGYWLIQIICLGKYLRIRSLWLI